MTVTAPAGAPRARARKPPTWDQIRDNIPAPGSDEGAYFHYTPAEAAKWLPFGADKLRKLAFNREVPHVNNGNRIWFSGMNVRAISEQYTIPVLPESKRPRAAA